MSTSNTPCLYRLYYQNIFHINEERSVEYQYFFLCRFKQIYLYTKTIIHIFSAEKFLSLVICSGEIESFEITSANTYSTLDLVELTIFFRLSM